MAFDIKPLEWNRHTNGQYYAFTPVGVFMIGKLSKQRQYYASSPNGFTLAADVTLAEAKAAVDENYRSRIMEALVEVKQ